MFIYAVLDENNIVLRLEEWEEPSAQSNYIQVQTYDTSLVGKWYNADTQTFTELPAHIAAEMSTDVICYKQQDVWLNDVLDGKAESDHTHSEYVTTTDFNTALDGKANGNHTHSDYVTNTALTTALNGKADADHTHSDYAAATHTHSGYVSTSALATALEDYATTDDLSEKADTNHIHSEYAAATHTHSNYASANHTHTDYATTTAMNTALEGKAASDHTHSNYAAANHNHDDNYADVDHTHTGFASVSHNHNNDYAAIDHVHTAYAAATHNHDEDYSAINHTHTGFASTSHNHDNSYAAINHTHSDYATTTALTNGLAGKSNTSHTHSQYATTTALNAIWNTIYPVGSIYLSVSYTNPGTLFGGTWEAFGQGRTLVGVSSGVASQSTGGSETVSIPAHTHTTQGHVLTQNELPGHSHELLNYNSGGYTDYTFTKNSVQGSDKKGYIGNVFTTVVGANQSHSHGNTGSAGGQSISVMQPYITCYMWKRTA